jgi:hypothetical protein
MISRSLFTLIIGIFSFTSGANPTHSCKETVQKFILLNGGLDIYSADLETLSSDVLQKKNWDYDHYTNLELHSSSLWTQEFTEKINRKQYEAARDYLYLICQKIKVDTAAYKYVAARNSSLWDLNCENIEKITVFRDYQINTMKDLNNNFTESYGDLLWFFRDKINKNLTSNRVWIDDIPENKEFLLYKSPKQSLDKSKKKKTIINKPMSATLVRDPDGNDYSYGEIFEFKESDDKLSSYKRDSIKFSTKIIDGKCYVIPNHFNLKFFSGYDILIKNLSKESCEEILSQKKKEATVPLSIKFENDGMDPNHFENIDKISLVLNVCKEMKDIIALNPQNNGEKKPTSSSNPKTSKQ